MRERERTIGGGIRRKNRIDELGMKLAHLGRGMRHEEQGNTVKPLITDPLYSGSHLSKQVVTEGCLGNWIQLLHTKKVSLYIVCLEKWRIGLDN